MNDKTKKRFEIRNMDLETVEKLNKIRALLNLSQSETLKKVILYYYEKKLDDLLKKFKD